MPGVDDDPVMGGPAWKASQRWILGHMRWWSESVPAPANYNPERKQYPLLRELYEAYWTGDIDDDQAAAAA